MDCLPFYYLMILSIFFVASFDGSTAAGCSGRLRLRASDVAKAEAQIDLSQLSEKQLQQLVQQLAVLQTKQEEESLEDQDFEDLQQDEDDHRGSSRPWEQDPAHNSSPVGAHTEALSQETTPPVWIGSKHRWQ
ncbi:GL19940 [Drosophila persimilis]|uniref:GL19940 n=1 Tax=Drosophila persimilis TaxID=7234 RepID=B4GYK7_DROPE|nr:GL19940 [Drosophila persimilis]